MQNKLQELTDKLYNEGLSKGREEGEKVLAQAREEANALLAEAKKEAQAIVAKAEKEAQDRSHKVESDLALAARQTLSQTRQ